MDESFGVSDGCLVRTVVPARGRPYEHRCQVATLEQVAHAVDESCGAGLTLQMVVEREDLPWTQVAVALAFMRERGIVEVRHRKNHAATRAAHLDAMTEYWALAQDA